MSITRQELLNAEAAQHAAAHDRSPQVRLVAGPGTGKSFAIEERVYWLLKNGISPAAIFVVSFTRAASAELGARIRSHCQRRGINEAPNVSVTTLHSLALRILKRAGQLEQYPTDPAVLDRWECKNIFDSEFSKTAALQPARCAEIRREHEAFWNTRSWTPPNFTPPAPPITDAERSSFIAFNGPRTQVYSCVLPGQIVYQCIEQVAAGTLNPVEILGIQHLIVDEHQDLNPCDLEFVEQLTNAGVTTFIAGDDDQSIYSFRFASPSGIQTFNTKHPSAATHLLEACFRCTPSILDAAKSVLARNPSPQRIPKNLRSLYKTSTPPVAGILHLWSFGQHKQEAAAIATSCQALINAGTPHREIIILLSNRALQEKPITDALEAAQIPYSPPREDGYNESDDGRFVLSCLRIACNKGDFVAQRTLLGILPGTGVSTCNTIAQKVLLHNLRYPDLFNKELPESIFSGRETQAIQKAAAIQITISPWTAENTLEDCVHDISELLIEHFDTDSADRWFAAIDSLPSQSTLKEVLLYLQADTDDQQRTILDDIALRHENIPPSTTVLPSRVRMMTVHGSKGLNALVVFVPGMEEKIWPGEHRIPYPGLVQESARLLYVAITRARAACIISFTKRRVVFGKMQSQTPSRFNAQLNGRFLPRQSGLSSVEASAISNCIDALQLPPTQITPAPLPSSHVPLSPQAETSSVTNRSQLPDQSILLDDLRRKISDRQVLCIIGAGVSIATTAGALTASWLGLLRNGLDYCMQVVQPMPPSSWRDNVHHDIETGQSTGDTSLLLSAAEKISLKLRSSSGDEYANWLDHSIGQLSVKSPSLVRSILALETPIATTNYDGLFEEASGLPPISSRDPRDIERAFRGEQRGVVHLHGWWKHADTVVLGIRTYEELLRNTHMQSVLRALASMKTLLFIGFGSGLGDPNFEALLNWRTSTFKNSPYRHYQLVKYGETIPSGSGLTSIFYGTEYSDLEPFVKSLRPSSRPAKVL